MGTANKEIRALYFACQRRLIEVRVWEPVLRVKVGVLVPGIVGFGVNHGPDRIKQGPATQLVERKDGCRRDVHNQGAIDILGLGGRPLCKGCNDVSELLLPLVQDPVVVV